jgi:CRP-like cAMP-binding protein
MDDKTGIYQNLRNMVDKLVQPDTEAWNAFVAKIRLRNLKKKEHYLREGEICNKVGFINKGCVRMYFLVDGEEICKDLQFENAFTGSLASLMLRKPAFFNIAAIEDTVLLEIQYTDLMELYERYPCWQKFGRLAAEALFIRKELREASFLKDSPEERYAKLLTEQPMVIQRVPLHYIASYLGMKPETLSRIRKKMAQRSFS